MIPGLTAEEPAAAVEAGYRALTGFNARLRRKGREVLEWCARANRGCLMVLARPYHMDPGIGHEIEVDLQASGYPVLWAQYFPIDDDLMRWAFGPDMQQIVERSGTLFFSFQDLDSTKPAGSVKIRVETIAHYLEKYAGDIIRKKTEVMAPGCPLLSWAPQASLTGV